MLKSLKIQTKLLSLIYVFLQFILIFLIAFFGKVLGSFNLLFLVGILIGAWAIISMKFKVSIFPTVANNSTDLVAAGPYKYIRHPMYTAVLSSTLSWVLNDLTYTVSLLFILLLIVLIFKSIFEENLLLDYFPIYKSYIANTKRFIPYIY